mgnify:CR=1 FL=1
MRISKLTDYGVLVMNQLAVRPQRGMSASELAQRLELPVPTVSKILKSLTQAGLLESRRGPHGGYLLKRAPQQISLGEILDALEGPLALTECSAERSECAIEAQCSMRRQWRGINRIIHDLLSQIDLARLNQGEAVVSLKGLGLKQSDL